MQVMKNSGFLSIKNARHLRNGYPARLRDENQAEANVVVPAPATKHTAGTHD